VLSNDLSFQAGHFPVGADRASVIRCHRVAAGRRWLLLLLSRLLSAAVRGKDDPDTTWHLGALVLVAIMSSAPVSRPCPARTASPNRAAAVEQSLFALTFSFPCQA
jgi:hypothetical protein